MNRIGDDIEYIVQKAREKRASVQESSRKDLGEEEKPSRMFLGDAIRKEAQILREQGKEQQDGE